MRRRSALRRGWRLLFAGLSLVVLAVVGALAYRGEIRSALARLPDLDTLAYEAGFGIEDATLTGQRFTLDDEVFDALDLGNVRSFVRFDSAAARARIERLPWVDKAVITRVFPGRLDIRISERSPSAIWRRGDRRFLIDASGRTLSPLPAEEPRALPVVAGEGAPAEAAAFLALLDRFPAVKVRVLEAERVAERRWSLHLSRNVLVHLPADREAAALEELSSSKALAAPMAARDIVLDLRSASRISVRPAHPPPAARTAAAP